MKKYIVAAIAALLFTLTTKAQKDTASVFAGLVGFESIKTEDLKNISGFANLRVGAQYTNYMSKKTELSTWVSFDPGSNLVLFKATGKTELSKNLYIQYGFGPTPGTLIRPFPLSVDGQFEFTSEGMPPGVALGGFISWKDTKLGAYTRNNRPEVHLGQNIGKLQTDVWCSKNQMGATAQFVNKRVYLMGTVTNENRQALATAIQITKSSPWKVVHDFGVSKGTVTNNLVGLQYPMSLKRFTDARFGFAYDFVQKQAGVFWLLGLNY